MTSKSKFWDVLLGSEAKKKVHKILVDIISTLE